MTVKSALRWVAGPQPCDRPHDFFLAALEAQQHKYVRVCSHQSASPAATDTKCLYPDCSLPTRPSCGCSQAKGVEWQQNAPMSMLLPVLKKAIQQDKLPAGVLTTLSGYGRDRGVGVGA
jgi:hypothetical protein